MKLEMLKSKFELLVVMLSGFILLTSSIESLSGEDTWKVVVKNADNDKGKIRLGVYDDASSFPNHVGQLVGLASSLKNGKQVLQLN